MSQHDYNIANADGATVRADLNTLFQAMAELNSGASAPSTTFAYMWWADTTTGILKQRNAANTNWVDKIKSADSVSSFMSGLLSDANAATALASLGGLAASGDGSSLTNVDLTGIKHLFVPASAMRPTVSNGCSFLTDVETTAGRPDLQVLDFSADLDDHAQFQIALPDSWDKGVIKFQVFWTVSAAVTTGVAWGLQGLAVSDNESIDTVFSSPVVVTDDAQGATEEQLVTVESGDLTIQGTPVDGDMTFFRLFRDVSDGNDDMTQNARLIGARLILTTDAGNDA